LPREVNPSQGFSNPTNSLGGITAEGSKSLPLFGETEGSGNP